MEKLHIISFDIPWPANYGGVIVVFHQLRALSESGVNIILHCFEYGDRRPQEMLNQYCSKIYYYPRSRAASHQFSKTPFIVKTRSHPELLENLKKDKHPILMEGLHCCGFIDHPALQDRTKLVRMHNIEWQYYLGLAKTEAHFLKRHYFKLESQKLKSFESLVFQHATQIIGLTENDASYFKSKFVQTSFIPAFHPYDKLYCKTGTGNYALFHGKLSVPDNEQAALLLIETFACINFPLKIAGLDPSDKLKSAAAAASNQLVQIIENPEDAQMQQLIEDAQVQVLWSFQNAGIKLKLINSLFAGRHVIANEHIVSNSGLESLVHLCSDEVELRTKVQQLMGVNFDAQLLNNREQLLSLHFSNAENAKKLINLIS